MKNRTPHKKVLQATVYLVVPILLVLAALMTKDWVNNSPSSESDHSLTDQEPTDLVENISTAKLEKFLNKGDIDSALPILEELRNKILIAKESDHQDEDIVYSMGSGFIQAYSTTGDKGYLQKAKEGFDHYIQMYPQG